MTNLPQPSKNDSRRRAWWQEPVYQSAIGVLAQAKSEANLGGSKNAAPQILLYAVVDQPQDQSTPPTPPPSSPSTHLGGATVSLQTEDPIIRVQALPLCSDFLSFLPSPPPSPPTNAAKDVLFLPSIEELRTEAIATEKKRKRVEEVFDTATEQRKKSRRKGGENVAAAASRLANITTLVGQKKPKAPQPAKPDETKNFRRPSISYASASKTDGPSFAPPVSNFRPHSRSPSFSSDARPASRRGLLDNNAKRSSLSRVTSLSEGATAEDANKEMVSRLVMAGMRLYGWQRKKPAHSRRNSENITNPASFAGGTGGDASREDAAKDEEYKLMYHQTYKAAVFAFVSRHIKSLSVIYRNEDANNTQRKQISTKPLHLSSEPLRDTVDKLLAIFCADPLADG
jgi:hypothetical protein